METFWFILLVSYLVTYLLQGLVAALSVNEKLMIERRLELINKPAVRSFLTKKGDILDCIEVHKQLAFDHPLLKNHSIQRTPSINTWKLASKPIDRSSILAQSRFLQKNDIRCPQGTVPIRRIKEEDLVLEKFSSLLGKTFVTSNSSNFVHLENDHIPPGHHAAALIAYTCNTGVYGAINAWSPDVKPGQFSDASVFVASDDGSTTNAVVAGWMVNSYLYQDFARLYIYWTKDSGQSTGCFDLLCPGFVQVSEKIPIGLIIRPISVSGGRQYYVRVTIKQDPSTKHWWLFLKDEEVGYWPSELFGTLRNGATRAGWGGEIYSPVRESAPAMGSGHFPDEGYGKTSTIAQLQWFGPDKFPSDNDLKYFLSKPDCYKVTYCGHAKDFKGHYMFFGGPPDCKLWRR